jgi:hypothetical protein
MLPRKAAVVMAAAAAMVEVVTAVAGIFTVVAISAVTAAGISAVGISAAGATSGADRLRDRVFAAIVLSQFIMPDQLPYGR